jgi:hypothetical protein
MQTRTRTTIGMGMPQLRQQRISVIVLPSANGQSEMILCAHTREQSCFADLLADVAENKDRIEAASKHIVILDKESLKV